MDSSVIVPYPFLVACISVTFFSIIPLTLSAKMGLGFSGSAGVPLLYSQLSNYPVIPFRNSPRAIPAAYSTCNSINENMNCCHM